MNQIDIDIFFWLNGLAGKVPWLDALFLIIMNDYLIPVLLSSFLLALWITGQTRMERLRSQWWMLVGVTGVGFSNIGVAVINVIWPRPRPFNELDGVNLLFYAPTNPSFPANPVAVGAAVATVFWVVSPRMSFMLFSITLLMGFARIYGGVFYPSDILAGVVLGIAASLSAALTFRLGHPLPVLFIRLLRSVALA